VSHLAKADKEQCAAFIVRPYVFSVNFCILIHSYHQRDEHVLVVWSDDLDQIVPLCNSFDDKLMKYVWQWTRHNHSVSIATLASNSSVPSATGSNVNLTEKTKVIDNIVTLSELVDKEKEDCSSETPPVALPKQSSGWGWRLSPKKKSAEPSDAEKGTDRQARPVRLFAPFYIGAGAGLALCELHVLFV